jgi:excisionase family DNA binding protein
MYKHLQDRSIPVLDRDCDVMHNTAVRNYYTPREAAEELGLSDRYVRKLLNSGKLEGERNEHGHWRIPKDVVESKKASSSRRVSPETDVPGVSQRSGKEDTFRWRVLNFFETEPLIRIGVRVGEILTIVAVLLTAWALRSDISARQQEAYARQQEAIANAWQLAGNTNSSISVQARVSAMEYLNSVDESFAGMNLGDADISGVDLPGADLRKVEFRGAILGLSASDETNEATLRGAHLEAADLRGAELSGANLRRAKLKNADLNGAVLLNAQLRGARLKGTVFYKAYMVGAELQGTDLRNADLRLANLSGADLGGAKHLTQAQINEALGDSDTQLPKGGERLLRPSHWEPALDLSPGRYSTDLFDAPMSFTLGEGWEIVGKETDTRLELDRQNTDSGMLFTAPKRVYDPSNPSSTMILPSPTDMVAWLRAHPYLQTVSEPVSVAVGGVPGKQFDVQIPAAPPDYPTELCGKPCLPLFVDDPVGGAIALPEGGYRIIVFANKRLTQGKQVVIFIDLEEDTPTQEEEVVKTIEWRGV